MPKKLTPRPTPALVAVQQPTPVPATATPRSAPLAVGSVINKEPAVTTRKPAVPPIPSLKAGLSPPTAAPRLPEPSPQPAPGKKEKEKDKKTAMPGTTIEVVSVPTPGAFHEPPLVGRSARPPSPPPKLPRTVDASVVARLSPQSSIAAPTQPLLAFDDVIAIALSTMPSDRDDKADTFEHQVKLVLAQAAGVQARR